MPTVDVHAAGRVRKTPGVRGGEAYIRDTRHTVAGLVQWQRLGLADDRILEHHPDLSLEDLVEAWAYAGRNLEEIERAIRDDEDAG